MCVMNAICYMWLMGVVALAMNEMFCRRGIYVFGW